MDLKTRGEERPSAWGRESWLWLLYLHVYLSLGLSYVNWASQECCLFSLRSSLGPRALFCFIFAGLSLPCLWPPPFPFPWSTYLAVPCAALTVASCPAGRFLGYSHRFKNFPHFVVIHTVKGFRVVNETDRFFFLIPLLFSVTQRVLVT